MANFDIPNENELAPGKVYNYDLKAKQYDITQNRVTNTYDQFIMLRDTLVYSKKYYEGKAWLKLVIWDSEETVEVQERQVYRQNIQPDGMTAIGNTITKTTWALATQFGDKSVVINKDWRYRIVHKEEIKLTSSIDKVYCYVDWYRKNAQGQYEHVVKWWICVFDREWAGWMYTVGDIFKKMTAFWYLETDLKKNDVLVLRYKDRTYNSSTGEPQGNDLTLQDNSNYWNIEYIDLPYNKIINGN